MRERCPMDLFRGSRAARKDPAAVALGRKGGLKGGYARAASMTAAERSASAESGKSAVAQEAISTTATSERVIY